VDTLQPLVGVEAVELADRVGSGCSWAGDQSYGLSPPHQTGASTPGGDCGDRRDRRGVAVAVPRVGDLGQLPSNLPVFANPTITALSTACAIILPTALAISLLGWLQSFSHSQCGGRPVG